MGTLRENITTRILQTVKNEELATSIELGIYNWAIYYAKEHNMNRNWGNPHFRNCYLNKAMNIVNNIDETSYIKNNTLLPKVTAGTVKPEQLPSLLPQQMYPEIWKDHIHNLKLKEEKALKPDALPTTNRFTCARCKQKDCVYHIMQIRSGDEGSTIFVRCNKCKHSWRINS